MQNVSRGFSQTRGANAWRLIHIPPFTTIAANVRSFDGGADC